MHRIALPLTLALFVACSSSSGGGGGGGTGGPIGGGGGAGGSGGSGGSGGGEVMPVTVTVFDDVRINSHGDEPNPQHAEAVVNFPAGPFYEVRLVADLRSTCFPWDQWKDDPPPSGQNWPPKCDAFDRNYEWVLDPAQKDGDPPGIELARSITPFGGPMHYEVDLTDVANFLPGPHRLRVTIPTYSDGAGQISGSDGGWNVSGSLVFTPGRPPEHVLAILPLYDGYLTSDGKAPVTTTVPFTLPAGTTHTRLEYRVTGHGGTDSSGDADCIGPAEEFCQRQHTLQIDGSTIATESPWRTDCTRLCKLTNGGPFGQYCDQDPCGSPQSVRAPRANWCPGSFTPPFVYEDKVVAPGQHTFSWTVSKIASGGGIRTSAVIFALGDDR